MHDGKYKFRHPSDLSDILQQDSTNCSRHCIPTNKDAPPFPLAFPLNISRKNPPTAVPGRLGFSLREEKQGFGELNTYGQHLRLLLRAS